MALATVNIDKIIKVTSASSYVLSMFTVAKAILEVLKVLQELELQQ